MQTTNEYAEIMACLQPGEGQALIDSLKQEDPTSEAVFLLTTWAKDRERAREYIQNITRQKINIPKYELDYSKMKIDEDGGIFIPFKLDSPNT